MNNDSNNNYENNNFNNNSNNVINSDVQSVPNTEQIETLDVVNDNNDNQQVIAQQPNNINVQVEQTSVMEQNPIIQEQTTIMRQNQTQQEQNISVNANLQNIVENQNISSNNTTKTNSSKKIFIPIALIVIILIGVISVFFLKDKFAEAKAYNQNLSGAEYEIAKILFSDYLEDFNEKNISVAEYDEEQKIYRCKYIIKEHTDLYQDTLSFSTKNFITYTLNSTTYEKTENMWKPNNYTLGTFEGFSNDIKNQALEIAKNNNYYTEENLSDADYTKILNIVLNNDVNNIKELIDANNYELKNSTLSTGKKVLFLYQDKNNSENYIEISSAYNNVKEWNIYSSSDKSLTNDTKYNSRYSSIVEKYIIDYDISIQSDLTEIESIYSKISQQ